jgi:hypothetical protein
MAERRTPEEIEARVLQREDLLERLRDGDSAALGELIEDATGAEIERTEVTLPRGADAATG